MVIRGRVVQLPRTTATSVRCRRSPAARSTSRNSVSISIDRTDSCLRAPGRSCHTSEASSRSIRSRVDCESSALPHILNCSRNSDPRPPMCPRDRSDYATLLVGGTADRRSPGLESSRGAPRPADIVEQRAFSPSTSTWHQSPASACPQAYCCTRRGPGRVGGAAVQDDVGHPRWSSRRRESPTRQHRARPMQP